MQPASLHISPQFEGLVLTAGRPLYQLIQADAGEGGEPVLRPSRVDAAGRGFPVCRIVDPATPLAASVSAQLETCYTRAWLLIGEMVRNSLLRTVPRPDQLRLPWLFRVGAEPVPEMGLWLEGPGCPAGGADLPAVVYTCLATDENSLAGGFVEAIATHEFGHALMTTLMPAHGHYAAARASRMHLTTAVTDRGTAFREGWGDHFQPLALHHSGSPALERLRRGFDPSPTARWTSAVEDSLRHWGIPNNLFIHEPVVPEDLPERTPDERYRHDLTSSSYMPEELKSAERMSACEGVVASVFYRLMTDPEIGRKYRKPAFYERFLPPGVVLPQGFDPSAHFGGYINVSLKVLAAMRHLGCTERALPAKSTGVEAAQASTSAPIVELVEACGALFPDEREAFYRSFLETTALVTAAPEARSTWRRLALAGRYGLYGEIRGRIKEWRELFSQTLAKCVESGRLAPLLGPEIWLESADLKVGRGLWMPPDRPLTVDLNAASPIDLLNLGAGLTWAEAKAVVAWRDEHGPFSAIPDTERVEGLSPQGFRALAGRASPG
jgi:hypothetical protein